MTIENRFLTNKDKKLLREINRVLVEQNKKLKMQELKELEKANKETREMWLKEEGNYFDMQELKERQ